METKPTIFAYNNFRNFLRDYYDYQHKQDSSFTKAYICKELGLPNSRSYFGDVLTGKFVSAIKIPLFIRLLRLNKDEAQFFRILVGFNQSDDPEEKALLFDQLISLNRTPKYIVPPAVYAYYKEWHHAVIRAILSLIDFTDGYHLLAKMVVPSITSNQARKSIQLLEELRFIKKDKDGFWRPSEMVISTGSCLKNDLIRHYQFQCIDIAKTALLKNKKAPQRVMTKMISISQEGYKKIQQKIDKFNSEITSLVHKDEGKADKVYQMILLLFPHSNQPDGYEKGQNDES